MDIRVLEYESKEIFGKFNIPLPANIVIVKGENIEKKVEQFSFPAIVKSQIAIGSYNIRRFWNSSRED